MTGLICDSIMFCSAYRQPFACVFECHTV